MGTYGVLSRRYAELCQTLSCTEITMCSRLSLANNVSLFSICTVLSQLILVFVISTLFLGIDRFDLLYFVENFCVYIHQRYWSVALPSVIWLCYGIISLFTLGNDGLAPWVAQGLSRSVQHFQGLPQCTDEVQYGTIWSSLLSARDKFLLLIWSCHPLLLCSNFVSHDPILPSYRTISSAVLMLARSWPQQSLVTICRLWQTLLLKCCTSSICELEMWSRKKQEDKTTVSSANNLGRKLHSFPVPTKMAGACWATQHTNITSVHSDSSDGKALPINSVTWKATTPLGLFPHL